MDNLDIEELSEYEYKKLCVNGEVLNNVLYVLYYDKKTCLLCQEEYKRSSADENPNFCPSCLKLLKGDK